MPNKVNGIPLVITMDGPAGVGKSSLAKKLAKELDLAYLDTGAMFRSIGLKALKLDSSEKLLAKTPLGGQELLDALGPMIFTLESQAGETILTCNGLRVGDEIRTEKVADAAAKVAQMPEVRAFLKSTQQKIGSLGSLVAEGRDMGTEVFPKSNFKFFLDANVEVRAERRYKQLKQMGQSANLEELKEQISQRDDKDKNRAVAPLKAAADAYIIDTSNLNIDEVMAAIKKVIFGLSSRTF